MRNRRSFFGALMGGIAACCGISRQAAARETKQMPVARFPDDVVDFDLKFRIDDYVYLGLMNNGKHVHGAIMYQDGISIIRLKEDGMCGLSAGECSSHVHKNTEAFGKTIGTLQRFNYRLELNEIFIYLSGFKHYPA